MTIYTYSEARQHLAEILNKACTEGAVQIRRRDGSIFQVTPVEPETSPLDVGYVDVALTRDDIVAAVRASRARTPHDLTSLPG